MIVSKGLGLKNVLAWSGRTIVFLFILVGSVAALYHYDVLSISYRLPWLPVSVIGTAVAFYVGFKNNQSYDRMWEARKIWGGIVNDSRSWGMMIDGFITNQFASDKVSDGEIEKIKKRLIYRHIGWLYTHRDQLLKPTQWEHISQRGKTGKMAEFFREAYGIGLIDEQISSIDVKDYFTSEEFDRLSKHANSATQIINEQSRDLRELREKGLLEDFRHMELAKMLSSFYTLQGKNERIKKFPLPRQYANISRYFVGIFILMLPFSMVPELLEEIGPLGMWVSVPITVLIGWVYTTMEMVGDYSENPFQGMANDIPMLSLCRTIEIDLREMLGETNLPEAIKAKNDILM